MTVRITYCQPCRYFGQVLSDLKSLYTAYNEQIEFVELIAGDNGVDDVEVDGDRICSKDEQERFPEEGELPRLIDGRTRVSS